MRDDLRAGYRQRFPEPTTFFLTKIQSQQTTRSIDPACLINIQSIDNTINELPCLLHLRLNKLPHVISVLLQVLFSFTGRVSEVFFHRKPRRLRGNISINAKPFSAVTRVDEFSVVGSDETSLISIRKPFTT